MEAVNLYLVSAIIVGILFPGFALLEGKKTHQYLLDNPEKKIRILRLTGLQLVLMMTVALLPFLLS